LLEDFVERKLKDFVKKIKASQPKNLYTLLLNEIERPLISLTLKETNGNQIQAALILGMNRNTLRKKIKDLRIPLKRN
jgi:two-component system nitrogen regulation response regulator GlnG